MRAAWRAGVSSLMLAGFSLVALVQLLLVLGFGIWLAVETTAGIGAKVATPLVVAVGAAGLGLVRAVRAKPEPIPGVLLHESMAPQLWHAVRTIAAEVGTGAPDEIRVVADVNAAVSEDTRLLGLLGGRRRLYVGMPLIQTLTVAQLRSVLAHELGHYSNRHTRFGAAALRVPRTPSILVKRHDRIRGGCRPGDHVGGYRGSRFCPDR